MKKSCFKSMFKSVLILSFLTLVMSSCFYKMPDEEHPRAVPQTNNMNEIKRSKLQMPTPEVKY